MSEELDRERMTAHIATAVNQILGQFVGEMQSDSGDDVQRDRIKKAVGSFLESLKPPVKFGPDADVEIVCDDRNNTPTTISQGYINLSFEPHTEIGRAYLERMKKMGVL